MSAVPTLAAAAASTAVAAAGVPLALAAASNAAARAQVVRHLHEASPARSSGAAAKLALPAGPAVARSGHMERIRTRIGSVPARLTSARDRRRRAEALQHVLTTLAQHLRAGGSLGQAVARAAATAPPALASDFEGVVHRARHGAGLVAGLRWWAALRCDDDLVRMVAASLAAAAETGGPAARAVDVVAELVRERQDLSGEVTALTAQARASAVVIGLAPLAMALMAAASDPSVARFLLTSRSGLAMLAGGVLLDAAGVAWMAFLLRRRA